MHSSLSCRGRVAYGMSLSKPPPPPFKASRVQQCLNKLKVRTGWLAGVEGEDSRVCSERVGAAKSQRLTGPQHRTVAPGLRGLL